MTARGLVQGAGSDPYTVRANSFLREQPAVIPVHFDHDRSWTLGSVCALVRSTSGLTAVARVERDDLSEMLEDGPWFWSRTRCVDAASV